MPQKTHTHNAFATLRFQEQSIGTQWESNWGNFNEIAKCLKKKSLLLISINFTPKTSHSCLKKRYKFLCFPGGRNSYSNTLQKCSTCTFQQKISPRYSQVFRAPLTLPKSQLFHPSVFADLLTLHDPRLPNTSWEGVLGMFWGSKYLLTRCLEA